jgi:hypothetical protein
VDRVHHWPGVNGLGALLVGRPLRATRPLHFFRPDGSMPETVEMPLTIPPELGPAADVLAELRERVRAVEDERAAERQRTGGRVCGRRAVLAQSWRGQPTSREPRRTLRPRVAAQNKWARIEALLRNRAFVEAYTTPAQRGVRASRPCSRRARTGSAGSRRWRWPRRERRWWCQRWLGMTTEFGPRERSRRLEGAGMLECRASGGSPLLGIDRCCLVGISAWAACARATRSFVEPFDREG